MGALKQLAELFPKTEIWMDSIMEEDILFGLENGSVGVTSAPTVTAFAVKNENRVWRALFSKYMAEKPHLNEQEILWECMYHIAAERSKLVLPLYDERCFKGSFCIQTNIYDYMNADKMIAQAKKVHELGPNFIIKIPTTAAGLIAMEEVAAMGKSVLATSVSSVSQTIAAAEALRRGVERRKAAGLSTEGFSLSLALQLGLPDECYTGYAVKNNVDIDPEALKWAAIAVSKKAYRIITERYPEIRFVLSNFLTEEHWREFMGGDLMLTFPRRVQNVVDVAENIDDRIDVPVKEEYVNALYEKIPLFKKNYDEGALAPEEFQTLPSVCRTIHFFTDRYEEALMEIRGMLIPDPYSKKGGAY